MEQSKDKVYINSGNADVIGKITAGHAEILDVGCGGGSLAGILKQLGHTVDGITISDDEMRAAEIHCRKVYVHNLETGLPAGIIGKQYDYIICSHVLEHIVYPENLLRHIKGVLKPGGRMIVALPNLMHYKSRMSLMAGNFDYCQAGIWDYTHVKWYTFKSAQNMLYKAGFQINTAEVTGELPFNSVFSKIIPSTLRRKMYKLLTGISKGLFGYQLLFTASLQGEV